MRWRIGFDGHPYLRYRNLKFKRETIIPIAPQLAYQIRRQQAYLNEAYGRDGTRFLLPNPPEGERGHQRGHGGQRHIATTSVGRLLRAFVRKADIRGSDGKLAVGLHPHLFRHHLATSLVNDRVPLPVIQRILDHGSIQMTSVYAQVNDETVKRELTGWQKRVNIRGERIALAPDSPLAQAAWMKDHIARAKQALPNGYCGLPLVQTCPHPNACLSCENFLTDASYRTIHEHQLAETQRLKADAEHNGQARLVELLQRDEDALSRMLTGLDELEGSTELSRPDESVDLVDLARSATWDRQTAAVRTAATKRTAHAEARVRKALSAIATSGAEVNFVAVASAARVSRQFLYSHPELRAEIEQLRSQTLTVARLPARASVGDDSARHRLRAALDDNQRLRDENRLLKQELAIAHGELRELRHSRARATVTQP